MVSFHKGQLTASLDDGRLQVEFEDCPDDGAIGTLSFFTTKRHPKYKIGRPDPSKAIQELTRLLTADLFKE